MEGRERKDREEGRTISFSFSFRMDDVGRGTRGPSVCERSPRSRVDGRARVSGRLVEGGGTDEECHLRGFYGCRAPLIRQ